MYWKEEMFSQELQSFCNRDFCFSLRKQIRLLGTAKIFRNKEMYWNRIYGQTFGIICFVNPFIWILFTSSDVGWPHSVFCLHFILFFIICLSLTKFVWFRAKEKEIERIYFGFMFSFSEVSLFLSTGVCIKNHSKYLFESNFGCMSEENRSWAFSK